MNKCLRHVLFLTLFSPLLLYAQGEQNILMVQRVPRGGSGLAVDFNNNRTVVHLPIAASNVVCGASGQPLFYTDGTYVYNRNFQLMPNGADLGHVPSNGPGYSMPPIIMMLPGPDNGYGIFTQRNGGIYYSIVDMNANNGLGAVLPDHKKIPLNAFAGRSGITMNAKAVAIQGCTSNWLVYRSRFAKEFRAFEVTAAGVAPDPVISEVGLLPVGDYEGHLYQGVMKASPDGRKLAIVAKGAIELFDFEKCSGRVRNPRLVTDDGDYYYGVCFSPDNSKLYATTHPDSAGRLYQFDLTQHTPAAIRASKTLIFTNPLRWVVSFGWYSWSDPLADLKIGPDNKIYFTNCFNDAGRPNYARPSRLSPRVMGGYHVINDPNQPGLACNPAANVVWVPVAMMGRDMPPDIVLRPQQDTVYSGVERVSACFRDSILLQVDTSGRCYSWDDGSDQAARMVYQSGIYWVQYTDSNCALHIDSFDVHFVSLPGTGPETYSCPNEHNGSITIIPADNTRFYYTWSNSTGNMLREWEADNGDTLSGITAGRYAVRLTTSSGCDTTLYAEVLPVPLPPVSYDADTTVCKGIPLTFTNTSDAPVWRWYFGDGNTSRERHVVHVYNEAGIYPALLVTENVEGCRDTVMKPIHVKELLLSLTATPDLLNVGESVTLQTSAPGPYRITAWLPESFFNDQSAYEQHISIDTTRVFTVVGASDIGCADSAEVLVTIHPILYLPTAFTPNGDGRNDVFRPAVSGVAVTVRSFHVFDRWGREVWSGWGSSDVVGWDGTYNGVPAQVGTYYYTIEAETPTGKIIRQKGDVTLVR